MNEKPSRLGRGLAALIGDVTPVESFLGPVPGGVRRLPVDFIIANKWNPRRDFDPALLAELAASIREKGVMQPLLVRPSGKDPDIYELIAGERRWRAAQQAGLNEVPVIIREVDDKEAIELAIIENVQRADLNPLEEAAGYEQLIEQYEYSQADLAQVIGKSRSHVANTLRLLKLPEDVRAMMGRGELTAGHARTLITADDPAEMAQRIVAGKLSVRQAEELAQSPERARQKASSAKDTDTMALERQLADALGLKVSLSHAAVGGKVEIAYKTLEQLDSICQRLLKFG